MSEGGQVQAKSDPDTCFWCHGSGKRLMSDHYGSGNVILSECINCSGTGKTPNSGKGNKMEDSAKMRATEARMKKTDTPFLDEAEGKKKKKKKSRGSWIMPIDKDNKIKELNETVNRLGVMIDALKEEKEVLRSAAVNNNAAKLAEEKRLIDLIKAGETELMRSNLKHQGFREAVQLIISNMRSGE